MTLLIAALAPVFALIFYIYFHDKHEKEPISLLIASFVLGAVVSIIITMILYSATSVIIPLEDKHSVLEQFIQAFFVVGAVEEFSKYILLRYYAQPKMEFNEPYDGIMYSVMISLGFAATENILYVIDGGLETALLRAITAVPAHAIFGILMGYFIGKAKFSKHKVLMNLIGLLLAILFHGAYDFFLFINFIPGISIGAFVSLIIGLILARKAIRIHQNNSRFKT